MDLVSGLRYSTLTHLTENYVTLQLACHGSRFVMSVDGPHPPSNPVVLSSHLLLRKPELRLRVQPSPLCGMQIQEHRRLAELVVVHIA